MRVLVQSTETKKYVALGDGWTDSHQDALNFTSTRAAFLFCLKKCKDADVILDFRGPDEPTEFYNMRIPVTLPAQLPAHRQIVPLMDEHCAG